jgi:hypothetical protein
MKTLSGTLKYAFVPAVVLVFIVACAALVHTNRGRVTIEKEGILLTGAKISDGDAHEINDILRKFDKSLYKIDVYKNGKLEERRGALRDVFVDKATASEAAKNATQPGFTRWTLQCGYDRSTIQSPPPTIRATIPTKKNAESEDLVRRLTPIFQKYSQR